ncbi:MAG: hypothetical protein WBW13_22140 [Pseudolabrys sp.]|jgi:hypothetical protein
MKEIDRTEAARKPETIRERLSNRRPSESFNVECNGQDYIATVSHFPDGRLGEIFLVSHKTGSHADTAARDAAIAASIAFQYGASPDTIRYALCRDSRWYPNGPLGAALDLIAAQDRGQR